MTLPYGEQAGSGGGGGASWKYTLAGAGDVNGHGHADVLVGVPSAGLVHVFFGSPSGLTTDPAATISAADVGLAGPGSLGLTLAAAGDVNGDGYADVIAGAQPSGNPVDLPLRQAYVFHGNASGLGPAPASKPTVPKGSSFFGTLVMGAGDVDGDGYTDVLVNGTPDGTPDYFAGSLSGADVDGDGFGDLAVVNGGSALLYPGSASGIVTTATALSTGGGFSAFHAALGSP